MPYEGRRPKSGTLLLAVGGAVLIAVTLFRVPLATVFTFGVLLICPLLMVGMHGGHHGADHTPADDVQGEPHDRNDDRVRHVRSTFVSPYQAPAPDPETEHHRREVRP